MPENVKDINDVARSKKVPSQKVAQAARAVAKRIEDERKDSGGGPPRGLLETFRSFRVLGELDSGEIVLFSPFKRKVYRFLPDRFRLDHLDVIGGSEIAARVVRSQKDANPGQIPFRLLKREILRTAGGTQLRAGEIGQGVNEVGGGRTLFVLSGSQGGLFDGSTLRLYREPIVDGKLIDGGGYDGWVNLDRVKEEVRKMNAERGKDVLITMRDHFSQWAFQGAFVPEVLAGFVAAQVVQAVWSWRANLWLTGRAGSGKTTLLEAIERILGPLAIRLEGSSLTEAAIRQALAGQYLVPLIDEFEITGSRQGILELLRSSSRGGTVYKGTPSQQVISTRLRHLFILASIEAGIAREAEAGRFLFVETRKDGSRRPRYMSIEEAEQFRSKLVAFCLWAAFPARDLLRRFDGIPGFDYRIAQGYAVPLSLWAVVEHDPAQTLRENLEILLTEKAADLNIDAVSDEISLLDDILGSSVRVGIIEPDTGDRVYQQRTILWLLQRGFEYKDLLESYGIKNLSNGKGIFFASQPISRFLLRDTTWRGVNIASILKRLPSAERCHQRMAGRLYKGVLVRDLSIIFEPKEEADIKEGDLYAHT